LLVYLVFFWLCYYIYFHYVCNALKMPDSLPVHKQTSKPSKERSGEKDTGFLAGDSFTRYQINHSPEEKNLGYYGSMPCDSFYRVIKPE
jgi:hypothetical protein